MSTHTLEAPVTTEVPQEQATANTPAAVSAPLASPFGHTPNYLLDVRLTVSAEIGRVELPIRHVLALAPGSLIELQRDASEPVDILANGRCVARGEIVVVGDQFGVRITELGGA